MLNAFASLLPVRVHRPGRNQRAYGERVAKDEEPDGVVGVAGSIPETTIEEIRARIDIVELISEYVVLHKRGRNYLGLCPFHNEKTPSFTVTADKQLFYCFGCGVGGNAFTFLMKRSGFTFREAAERLAERAGVTLPEDGGPAPEGEKVRRLLGIVELAARFYRHVLLNHPAGQVARRYLDRRGINNEVSECFRLGYAPPGPRAFMQVLQRRGFSIEEAVEAGLLSGTGTLPMDRFRGRLMVPICDHRGRIISFGGRVLDESKPKYLNGPETTLFQKGKTLFAINLAAPALRDKGRALLMEGYMDVLAAHQFGITSAVASLGTSLTVEQARVLRRYAGRATVCYDADTAGQKAALRALGTLREAGLAAQVVTLPDGMDPDDCLRREGAEAFNRRVDEAPSAVEFRLEHLLAEHEPRSVEDRVRLVRQLQEDVAGITSALEQDEYIRLIAQRIGLAEEATRAELWPRRTGGPREDKSSHPRHTKANISSSRRLGEIRLLGWMLQDQRLAAALAGEVGLDAFQDPDVREAAEAYLASGGETLAADLAGRMGEGAGQALAAALVDTPAAGDVDQAISQLKQQALRLQASAYQQELRHLDAQGDREAARTILARIADLRKQIEHLKAEE